MMKIYTIYVFILLIPMCTCFFTLIIVLSSLIICRELRINAHFFRNSPVPAAAIHSPPVTLSLLRASIRRRGPPRQATASAAIAFLVFPFPPEGLFPVQKTPRPFRFIPLQLPCRCRAGAHPVQIPFCPLLQLKKESDPSNSFLQNCRCPRANARPHRGLFPLSYSSVYLAALPRAFSTGYLASFFSILLITISSASSPSLSSIFWQ